MLRFLRTNKLERYIKKQPLLFYFLSEYLAKINFLLPYEDDWFFFKKIKLNEKTIILDIGSHIGESVKTFRKFFNNEIYCFEPNKRSFKKLKNNLRFDNRIKLFNYGISSTSQKVLYTPKYNEYFIDMLSSSSLNASKQNLKRININQEHINFVREKLIFKKKINLKKKISILKIDVEGSEFEVLSSCKNLILKDKPLLFIEYHKNNFKKIISKFKNYQAYYYNHKKKEIFKINSILQVSKILKLLNREDKAFNFIMIPKEKKKKENISFNNFKII